MAEHEGFSRYSVQYAAFEDVWWFVGIVQIACSTVMGSVLYIPPRDRHIGSLVYIRGFMSTASCLKQIVLLPNGQLLISIGSFSLTNSTTASGPFSTCSPCGIARVFTAGLTSLAVLRNAALSSDFHIEAVNYWNVRQ